MTVSKKAIRKKLATVKQGEHITKIVEKSKQELQEERSKQAALRRIPSSCLVFGDSFVDTNKGQLQLKDIYSKDESTGIGRKFNTGEKLNVINRFGKEEPLLKIQPNPEKKEVVRITVDNCVRIEVAPDTRVLVFTESCKYSWKKARFIEENDVVCLSKGNATDNVSSGFIYDMTAWFKDADKSLRLEGFRAGHIKNMCFKKTPSDVLDTMIFNKEYAASMPGRDPQDICISAESEYLDLADGRKGVFKNITTDEIDLLERRDHRARESRALIDKRAYVSRTRRIHSNRDEWYKGMPKLTLPVNMTITLARLLGYFMDIGRVYGDTTSIYANTYKTAETISELLYLCFNDYGLKARSDSLYVLIIKSAVIADFFRYMFNVDKQAVVKKAKNGIPDIIKRGDISCRSAFLSAVLSNSAVIRKGTTKHTHYLGLSHKAVKQIQQMCLSLGISYRYRGSDANVPVVHSLIISYSYRDICGDVKNNDNDVVPFINALPYKYLIGREGVCDNDEARYRDIRKDIATYPMPLTPDTLSIFKKIDRTNYTYAAVLHKQTLCSENLFSITTEEACVYNGFLLK